jgi:CxxC-x17-CxxC domain-containing protein
MRENGSRRPFRERQSSGRHNKRAAIFSKHNRKYEDRGQSRRGDDARPRLEMFDVVCARCGRDTQVPFRPSGDKPVYCRDCFRKDSDAPRRDSPRDSGSSADTLAQINRKLDLIMRALNIR